MQGEGDGESSRFQDLLDERIVITSTDDISRANCGCKLQESLHGLSHHRHIGFLTALKLSG